MLHVQVFLLLPQVDFQLLFIKSNSKIMVYTHLKKTFGQTKIFSVLYQFKAVLLIVTAHAPF